MDPSTCLLVLFALAFGAAQAEQPASPYAGQEHRQIKALSREEIDGLLAGKGRGYARSAELNGYPGPAHVLELAQDLQLTERQLEASRELHARRAATMAGRSHAMTGNKTKPTESSVSALLDSVEGDERRRDCEALVEMIGKITGKPAVMWGPSMVGFDTYHYRYESGREGDWLVAGFSPRKGDISVYLTASTDDQPELLARLGRHKMGKSCLYIRRLSDVDLGVLEQLIAGAVAEVKRRYG